MTNQISLLDTPALTDPAPGRARRSDPPTSKRAAANVAFRTGSHKARILRHLSTVGANGSTDYELWRATGGAYPHVAGTRRGELEALGLVRRTALTRPTGSGEDALVHVITARGLEALAELGDR